MNAACQEEADRDDLIEGLLAPRKGWPRYTMPSAAVKGSAAPSGGPEAAAAAGKAQKGDLDAQGHFVPAFALALGAELGFSPVLQPSQGTPRYLLILSLLPALLEGPICSAGLWPVYLTAIHTLLLQP